MHLLDDGSLHLAFTYAENPRGQMLHSTLVTNPDGSKPDPNSEMRCGTCGERVRPPSQPGANLAIHEDDDMKPDAMDRHYALIEANSTIRHCRKTILNLWFAVLMETAVIMVFGISLIGR
ncbi:MAG: hypothetical protein WC704_16545 [Sphingomonas sp.]|jgi:hypothetical protein